MQNYNSWQQGFVPTREEIAYLKLLRYEHSLVKHLLKWCNFERLYWTIRGSSSGWWEDRFLRLSAFHREVNFPWWITASIAARIQPGSLSQTLTGFAQNNSLFYEFGDAKERLPAEFEDGRMALVFAAPGCKFMSMYDHRLKVTAKSSSTRLLVPSYFDNSTYVIQRLDDFLIDMFESYGEPNTW